MGPIIGLQKANNPQKLAKVPQNGQQQAISWFGESSTVEVEALLLWVFLNHLMLINKLIGGKDGFIHHILIDV
jgi:hypothetical protein